MAFIPKLETGEKLIRQFRVKPSKKAKPFCFAVSDCALYWPETKLTFSDPYYFRRIPHDQVQSVSLNKVAPYAVWLLTLLVVVSGLLLVVLLLVPFFELIARVHLHFPAINADNSTKRSFACLALLLIFGGIYLSVLANRRFGLRVRTSNKSFTWKPPLLADEESRIHITAALNDMLQICQQAGLNVHSVSLAPPTSKLS